MQTSNFLSRLIYLAQRLRFVSRPHQVYNSFIHKKSIVQGGSQFIDSSIDAFSFIGYDCIVSKAKIAKFCSIANNVIIGPSEHSVDKISTSPCFFAYNDIIKDKFAHASRPDSKLVIIGNDVWIGINSSIKAGISIGHGAVVGMNSVVTRDVPNYAIVAGNPARLIRYRFDEQTIKLLIASNWWNLKPKLLKPLAEKYIETPHLFAKAVLNCSINS